jgi:hypothetical protein
MDKQLDCQSSYPMAVQNSDLLSIGQPNPVQEDSQPVPDRRMSTSACRERPSVPDKRTSTSACQEDCQQVPTQRRLLSGSPKQNIDSGKNQDEEDMVQAVHYISCVPKVQEQMVHAVHYSCVRILSNGSFISNLAR